MHRIGTRLLNSVSLKYLPRTVSSMSRNWMVEEVVLSSILANLASSTGAFWRSCLPVFLQTSHAL